LFHPPNANGKCHFWDELKKIFMIKAYLAHHGVRLIDKDGKSTVSKWSIKKLHQYTFPSLGIHKEADKEKILRDLHQAAADLPKATTEEIIKHAKVVQRHANLARIQEKNDRHHRILTEELSVMMAVAQSCKRDKERAEKESKPRRGSSRTSRRDTDTDSDDEKASGSDWSGSEDSNHS
jgi:hypothetical protein